MKHYTLDFLQIKKATDLLINDAHYDKIRNWARLGDKFQEWPYYQRSIFPQETLMKHPSTGDWVQAGFGHDLFMTKRLETYFSFCFYGYEFTINVGGPSIKGYKEWLKDNNNISPIVERIGLRLEKSDEAGRVKYFLVGQQDKVNAMHFDRRQMAGIS